MNNTSVEPQYLGLSTTTESCLASLARVCQVDKIHSAILISFDSRHGFILRSQADCVYVIRSGFSSGYSGEGPKGLSSALNILLRFDIEIGEIAVDRKFLQRLNNATLTDRDFAFVETQPSRKAGSWSHYLTPCDKEIPYESINIGGFFPLEMPFSLLDKRIMDLALCFFQNPDHAVNSAFRRLEELVRARTGLAESGSKLFSKAFHGDNPILYWELPDKNESKARGNLFCAVFSTYRNARAHRELKSLNLSAVLREFLMVNELFQLEATSVDHNNMQK